MRISSTGNVGSLRFAAAARDLRCKCSERQVGPRSCLWRQAQRMSAIRPLV